MKDKRVNSLDRSQRGIVREIVTSDLDVYDLASWQAACKGFGPIHYDSQTRKQWFRKNNWRINAAREIVDTVDDWTTLALEKDELSNASRSGILKTIIRIIREAQENLGMNLGKLNVVKLAGFRTLIQWGIDDGALEKGPYEGAEELPPDAKILRTKEAKKRKRQKGEYTTPVVQLNHDRVLLDNNTLSLTVRISNYYMHPFQNVELELDIGGGVSLMGVIRPHDWSSGMSSIRIGFIEASLDTRPKTVDVNLIFRIPDGVRQFRLGGNLVYDDTMKGSRAKTQLDKVSIRL